MQDVQAASAQPRLLQVGRWRAVLAEESFLQGPTANLNLDFNRCQESGRRDNEQGNECGCCAASRLLLESGRGAQVTRQKNFGNVAQAELNKLKETNEDSDSDWLMVSSVILSS